MAGGVPLINPSLSNTAYSVVLPAPIIGLALVSWKLGAEVLTTWGFTLKLPDSPEQLGALPAPYQLFVAPVEMSLQPVAPVAR